MINNISKLKDWQIKKLPEVVFFQEGPGVRNNQYTQTGVKLLNVANLVEGQVVLENTNRYISEEEAYGKYNHFLVDEGDLIIASSGIKVEYFDKKMGFVKKEHLPLCMNTSTIRFKSLDNGNLNLKYFSYFLKSIYFKKQIARLITGSAQLNFGPSHLKQIDVIVPPINIQNNIVNILDKSKYLIDKRKEQIESLDELVKSKFIEMFGNPLTNSKKQNLIKLSECIKEKGDLVDGPFGSSVNTKVDYIDDGEIPVIRTKNVNMMSFNSTDLKFMTREKYESVIRSQVLPGDIILTKVGTIGNVCIFPEIYKEAVLSTTGSCRIRVNEDKINKIFLAYYLIYYREKLLDIASAGVQPFLNMNHIKNLDIFYVECELQNQFADFVKQVDKLKFEMEKSLKELEDNFNSLMQKAFKGELFD